MWSTRLCLAFHCSAFWWMNGQARARWWGDRHRVAIGPGQTSPGSPRRALVNRSTMSQPRMVFPWPYMNGGLTIEESLRKVSTQQGKSQRVTRRGWALSEDGAVSRWPGQHSSNSKPCGLGGGLADEPPMNRFLVFSISYYHHLLPLSLQSYSTHHQLWIVCLGLCSAFLWTFITMQI